MMWQWIVRLTAIALLVGACASTASTPSAPISVAEKCAQRGGVWRATLGFCEQSTGGGGGY